MLVKFMCKDYENVVMFGDVAVNLIHMMGQSGNVPSAISASEIPDTLVKLESALSKSQANQATTDYDEPDVSIVHRAIPLKKLLQFAIEENSSVMWEYCDADKKL